MVGGASRPAFRPGSIKGGQDLLCGLMFAGIGLLGLWIGRDYPMGTPVRLGTGVFPALLCWGLIGVGGIVFLKGLLRGGPSLGHWAWRPVLLVGLAAIAFALLIEPAGLIVSMVALMVLGGLAGQDHHWREFAVFSVIMVLLAVGIFIWGLDMPIKVFPWS